MIQAPIFHVNGDDPEAVVRVARLAFDYRQAFNKDVVIDMVCYRRRGHNEGDDPSMTNPEMYKIIDAKRSVRKLYTEELIGRGDISLEDAEESLRDFQDQLETVFKATRDASTAPPHDPRPPGRAGAGRRDRHRRRAGQAHRRRARRAAGRVHRAQAGPPGARAPREDGGRRRHRLGLRRDHRVRFAGRAGHDGPPVRPGLAPRHVRPAVRGDRRRRERRRLPADRRPGDRGRPVLRRTTRC